MRTLPLHWLLTSVLFVSVALHAQKTGSQVYQAIPAPLADSIPSLNKQSSWEQNTTYEGRNPNKSQRGVYPVGNGKVFCYMGLGERANTIMALTGPSYAHTAQRLPRGNFGELTMDLGAQDLPMQRVRRVAGANFVVTEDRSKDGLALRTLTFAAPSSTTITRVVQVLNGTKASMKGLKLFARLSSPAKARGKNLIVSHQNYEAAISLSAASIEGNALVTTLGELPPGTSSESVLTISTGNKGTRATDPSMNLAQQAAKKTTEWWRNKLRHTSKLETDHRRVMDLFGDWKILMLTMRDAQSGVVAPMVTRRGAMIRESSGPLLTFLRYNMWDEARGILDYFYNAIRLTGAVREHYPTDLDFSSLKDQADYSHITIPSTDLASWIVVHHLWYFRATRDAQFIKQRQPFLHHCLTKQKRGKKTLMHFSGHENFIRTLYELDINALPSNPLFIAENPKQDRKSYSLTGSVLFLMAIQGYGDMLDGIAQMENPEAWVNGVDADKRPSYKWVKRSFTAMTDIESNFYVTDLRFPIREDIKPSLKFGEDWTGFFAPAISPVAGQPHKEPFANINLMPLWIGFTFPTGERSRHNLRNTLGRLRTAKSPSGKRLNTLVGTTATIGHFTGDVPGMLLTALVERDGGDRNQALQDLMTIAKPACEWAVLYNPQGRPIASPKDPEWPDRMSPNECGINLDALVFALNGIRHINVPNFDNKSIKLKLRLPPGAKFLKMDNLKKDGRAFSVHIDEFFAPLSPDEIKRNDAQSDKDYKKDPNIDHRRFRFRMRLLSDNPPKGRYQVDADVSGTMFVRYLFRGRVNGQSGDIDEREFWQESKERFFLDDYASTTPSNQALSKTEGAQLLVLTNRSQCSEVLGTENVSYVDTGLPFSGRDLVKLMIQDGKATHPKLMLDVDYDASDSRSFKQQRFWRSKNWEKALADYEAAGGKVITPQFVEQFEVERDRVGENKIFVPVAAPGGRLQLDGKGPATTRFLVRCKTAREDLVLRLGTGCGYTLLCNGEILAEQSGPRTAIRDSDSLLLSLKQGENIMEIRLHADGPHILFAQITDSDGLPVTGLR